jgi:carbonic anhydrase
LPAVDFVNDKEGKPVSIQKFIGRRPIAAFGNSDGDLQMLQWIAGGSGLSFCLYVHHDDSEREWAYDRQSSIGLLDKGLDEASARGWTVASMKRDWKRILMIIPATCFSKRGGNMKETSGESKLVDEAYVDRRTFLSATFSSCAVTGLAPLSLQFATSLANSLTKEERDNMTPSQVIDELRKGNERFRAKKMVPRDYLAEKRSSAAGQYPAAVVLGCIDSRVPAEIIFDAGIGDTFIGRVAGNVVNDDMLGSMEFSCAVSGAKVVLVLGHTACGAVKGAIDDVVLGNLTGLLARIKPAIPATKFDGEKSSKNAAYVDAVARTNVVLALAEIRRRSPILEELEKKGTIQITGAMYYLSTGVVEFL